MKFFKDSKGRVALIQWPNLPLYGWIVFKVLSLFPFGESTKSGLSQTSTAFLFVWAFLELTKGVNYFRKLLGLAILLTIIASFFID